MSSPQMPWVTVRRMSIVNPRLRHLHHRREVHRVKSRSALDLNRIAGSSPAWTSLDDAISWASDWAVRQDTTVDQPVFSDLAAGEAASVDIHYDDGWGMTDFAFVDSDRCFLLQCGAEDPPTDRWLSIAETFEFLPAEE